MHLADIICCLFLHIAPFQYWEKIQILIHVFENNINFYEMHIVDIKLKANFLSTPVSYGDQFYIDFLQKFPVDVGLSHEAS